MNYSEIILAINEVLQAQTVRELESVLSRHPELLKEETLMTIETMTKQAKQSSQTEIAEALQLALNKIAAFIQSLPTQQIPLIEPKVAWAIKARHHLALRKPEQLDQAIAEAGNEHEIVRLLEAFKQSDFEKIDQLTEQIIIRLQQETRDEEALTTQLICFDTRAVLAEHYIQYPLEDQRQVRETGIQACQLAVQIAVILQDKPCQAFYLSLLASGFIRSRQFREAEYFKTEALQVYRKLAESEPHIFLQYLATTLTNLGTTQREQKKLVDAEASYTEALQIYWKLAETESHIFLQYVAAALTNLGIAQRNQRKLADAEASCTEALQIYQKLAESEPLIFLQSVAGTLTSLGNVQLNQGKLADAEHSLTEALQIYQKLAESEPHIFLPYLAITLNSLGSAQRERKKMTDAEASYNKALQIYRKLAEAEPHIFLPNVALILDNLGNVQREQRNFADAEALHTRALQIRRKLVETESHIFLQDVALTLDNLGIVQRELGITQRNQRKSADAVNSCTEALQIYRRLAEIEPHIFLLDTAIALVNLGNAQSEQKKLADAKTSYIEALQIYRKLAETEPNIFSQYVAMTLNNLGYLQIETDVEKAEKYYEEARKLVDELREKAVIFDDKNRVMQSLISVYDGLLACYIKKQEWRKVLEIAELGKSRSLADLLNLKSEDLQPKAPTPDTLATVKDLGKRYSDAIRELQQLESIERYLSQELHQIEADKKQIEDDDSKDDGTKLGLFTQIAEQKQPLARQKEEAEQKRFYLQSELKTVLAEINKYDSDFPPKAVAIKPENIFGIAENLKRTIVMFRVLRESTAIIFVFPDGKLQVEEVLNFGQRELLDLYIHKWLKPYKESEKDLHGWLKAIVEVLYEIDEKLIFKVREVLNDKTDVKDVLFVPNQSLALLPLHVACREENGKIRYFLEDYNVSYCPSVSVFKRCLENEKPRSEKTLGIITPTKDLAGFNEEQLKLLDDFNIEATKLSNDGATLHNVQTALKNDYGFIHFFCHGKYDEGNQFDSGLRMTDKVLKLSEIMNNDLQTNWLTVLSACETGVVNAWSATDEHFGLPLGFVFAGSPSVWASLWSVTAATTSDLMQRAYQNLNKAEYRNNKSEALRQAQLEMSQDKDFSHPFYWAGFQHFGA